MNIQRTPGDSFFHHKPALSLCHQTRKAHSFQLPQQRQYPVNLEFRPFELNAAINRDEDWPNEKRTAALNIVSLFFSFLFLESLRNVIGFPNGLSIRAITRRTRRLSNEGTN